MSVSDPATVVDLGAIVVPRADVLRLLGGRGREPRPSVAAMVDEELAAAAELAAPRAALRLAPEGFPIHAVAEPDLSLAGRRLVPRRAVAAAGGEPPLYEHDACDGTRSTLEPVLCRAPLVAAVCTVGPALEARVAGLIERGERPRALVADAVASAAVEAAADRAERLAGRLAGGDGCTGRRVSPGYGAWPLEAQRALVAFVDAAAIGVTLTPQLMMVPRKSVSFVVPTGPDPEAGGGERCERCDLETCPFRAMRSER